MKKDPTMSLRKCTNELKVREKTVRRFKPDLNTIDYTRLRVLEKNEKQMQLPIQILVR